MKKTEFEGYARKGSFKPIDAGWQSIAEQEKHDAQVIRGRRQNLSALVSQNRQAASDMRSAQRGEVENQKLLADLENQPFEVRRAALLRNRETAKQSNEARISRMKDQQELSALSKFSSSIANILLKATKSEIEANQEAIYNHQLQEGLSPDQKLIHQLTEADLLQTSFRIQGLADEYYKKGAPPEFVTRIRKSDNAVEYMKLKAKSEMAGDQFGPWATSQLIKNKITGAADKSIALKNLHTIWLKANGLYGLKADFLDDANAKMRASSNTILGNARMNDAVLENEAISDKAKEALINKPTKENMYMYLETKARDLKKDGTRQGPAYAVRELLKILEDPTVIVDRTVLTDTFYNLESTDQNSILGKRYESDYKETLFNRDNSQNTKAQAEKNRIKNEGVKIENQLLEVIQERGKDIDEHEYKKMERILSSLGVDTSKLKHAYNVQTTGGQNEQWWRGYLQQKVDEKSITSFDLQDVNIPSNVRNDFKEIAKENEKLILAGGMSLEKLTKSFADRLDSRVRKERIGSEYANTSVEFAADYATKEYFREVTKNGGDHNKAYTETIKSIDGYRIVSPSITNKLTSGVYADFALGPTLYDESDTNVNQTFNDLLEHEDLKERLKTPIITKEKAFNLYNKIKSGGMYKMPTLFERIYKHDPTLGTPKQLLETNLKAYGYPVNFGNDWRTDLEKKAPDIELKNQINKIRTQADLIKNLQALENPKNPELMTPRNKSIIENREVVSEELFPDLDEDVAISFAETITASDGAINPDEVISAQGDEIKLTGNSKQWLLNDDRFYYHFEKNKPGVFKLVRSV